MTRADTLGASLTLRRLRDAGLLEQKGRGSGTYYLPTLKLLGNADDPPLSSNPGGLSSNPPALSSNPRWQGLPAELRELVAGLGQRATPDKLRDAIIRLCQHRPWQAFELAGLFGRNPVYLGTQHLRPLVSASVLAYTIPDQPNHPHQAYRAVDGTGEAV